MENWENIRLTSLADFINGYAFKPDDWSKEGLPIIRIEQLRNEDAQFDHFNGELPLYNIIENGDLIFSWSASLFLKIWDGGKAVLNQHLFKVIPNDNIDKSFLKYLIQHNIPGLLISAHGSTMQHITRKELAKYFVKIPILKPIQTRIAEILSTADEAIEQTEKLIAKYQRIKTGLMQDLLTKGIDEHGNIRNKATHKFVVKKGIEVPEEWEVEELHNILAKPLTYGIVQPGNHNPDGIYIIRSQDYSNGWNSLDSLMKVSREIDRPYERSRVCESDLLITVVGANVGRMAIVPGLLDGANISRSVARMAIDRKSNSSLFYYYYLLSRVDKYLRESTVGGAQPVLNLKELNTFKIVKPDLDEQKLIEQKLISINDLVIEEKKYLKKLHSIKNGLMQDLLNGRVRVKVEGSIDGY